MYDFLFFVFQGILVENNVTGRLEPREAPVWKRRAFRYLVSFPVIGMCLALVFVVMFLMLRFQVSYIRGYPNKIIEIRNLYVSSR